MRPSLHLLLGALFASACIQAPAFQGVGDAGTGDGILPTGSISVLALSGPGVVAGATIVVIGTGFRAVATTGANGDAIIADVPADSTVWVERRLGTTGAPLRAVTMIANVQPGDHLFVGESVAPIINTPASVRVSPLPNGADYRVLSSCLGYPETTVITQMPLTLSLTRTNACDAGYHRVLVAVRDTTDQQLYSIVLQGVLNSQDAIDFSGFSWLPNTKYTHKAIEVPDSVRGLYADVASVIDGTELDGPRSISASGAPPLGEPSGPMSVVAQAQAADLIYLVDLAVESRLEQYIAHRIPPPTADVADKLDLAPSIGPATLTGGAVTWEQDTDGTYQLLLVDAESIRTVDNATLRYRYILPAAATPSFVPPPLPEEMIDAAASSAVTYKVNLLRFDDDTTYDDVREQADTHVLAGGNYGTSFLGAQRRSPKPPIARVAQSGVRIF